MAKNMDESKEMVPLKGDVEEGDVQVIISRPTRIKNCVMDNLLMILTLVGVVFGFIIGFTAKAFSDFPSGSPQLIWLGMPGDIFIRLLEMSILPLIGANVVVVTASLDPKVNGKISIVALVYILAANTISAIIGVTSALIIRPGVGSTSLDSSTANVAKLTTSDVFADLLFNFFPNNIVGACIYKTQTRYSSSIKEYFNTTSNETVKQLVEARSVGQASAVNMIGIIFCAFLFGLAARIVKEDGVAFLTFFKSVASVVIQVMRWLLWLTPVGVCFMIAAAVAQVDNILETLQQLALFICTVCVGLAVHFFLMQIVLFAASRKNPFALLPLTFRTWFISFATTSPIVAIPDMYECCDKHGISTGVSRFVIPFAAALKGDGSAVFITAAAVFMGQLNDYPLNPGTIFVIILLVASAMMALPNVPSASIVILVTILSSVGIPTQYVGMLFTVDWLLDRLRSGAIGMSHCYCAAFCNHVCMSDLKREAELTEHAEHDQHKKENGVSNSEKDEFAAKCAE